MHKPEALKRVLLERVPTLKDNPERLSIFVDKGKLVARATTTLSFEYHYTLNVVIQDYAGSHDALMLPILVWIAEAQPDLLERAPNEPLTFESELLDSDASDVSLDLQLSERVLVERKQDGTGYNVRHLEDGRAPDAFAGVCGATLWQLELGDDVLFESPNMPPP
jgi:hypothetical protein